MNLGQGLARAGVVASVATLTSATTMAAQAPPRVLGFEMLGTLPVLSAQVEGRPVRLLLDTGGAAALALRPDVAAALTPTDMAASASAGASSTASPPASSTAPASPRLRLQLGAGEPVELPAALWRKSSYPPGIDGYLGWGYLRQFSVVLDYGRQQLQLGPAGQLAPACGEARAALKHLGSLPYVTVLQDGQPLPLGLETGANQNVLLAGRVPGAATAGERRALPATSWEGRPLALGGFQVIELQLPVLAGFLGHGFFATHRVCLDARSAAVAIEPLAP